MFGEKTFILHLRPSGILRKTTSILGMVLSSIWQR